MLRRCARSGTPAPSLQLQGVLSLRWHADRHCTNACSLAQGGGGQCCSGSWCPPPAGTLAGQHEDASAAASAEGVSVPAPGPPMAHQHAEGNGGPTRRLAARTRAGLAQGGSSATGDSQTRATRTALLPSPRLVATAQPPLCAGCGHAQALRLALGLLLSLTTTHPDHHKHTQAHVLEVRTVRPPGGPPRRACAQRRDGLLPGPLPRHHALPHAPAAPRGLGVAHRGPRGLFRPRQPRGHPNLPFAGAGGDAGEQACRPASPVGGGPGRVRRPVEGGDATRRAGQANVRACAGADGLVEGGDGTRRESGACWEGKANVGACAEADGPVEVGDGARREGQANVGACAEADGPVEGGDGARREGGARREVRANVGACAGGGRPVDGGRKGGERTGRVCAWEGNVGGPLGGGGWPGGRCGLGCRGKGRAQRPARLEGSLEVDVRRPVGVGGKRRRDVCARGKGTWGARGLWAGGRAPWRCGVGKRRREKASAGQRWDSSTHSASACARLHPFAAAGDAPLVAAHAPDHGLFQHCRAAQDGREEVGAQGAHRRPPHVQR